MNKTEINFDALMSDVGFCESKTSIALALSGGGDSMALALLLNEFCSKKSIKLVALIVNHNLRDDSRSEAEWVKSQMDNIGVECHILDWVGDKPDTGIQENARNKRYQLLTEKCHELGIETLAFGHNLEDQNETFWIRLISGSGIDGLSGMASSSKRNDIKIIRPLLPISREELREICKSHKQTWIDDPSNQNENFTRVNIRKNLKFFEEAGLSQNRLNDIIAKISQANDALKNITDKVIAKIVRSNPYGYVTIDLDGFYNCEDEIKFRILSNILQNFSNNKYPARSANINELISNIGKKGSTLSGCEIIIHDDKICIFRELLKIEGKLYLNRNNLSWDNRFIVPNLGKDYYIKALGEDGVRFLKDNIGSKGYKNIPYKILKTVPAIYKEVVISSNSNLLYKESEIISIPAFNFGKTIEIVNKILG